MIERKPIKLKANFQIPISSPDPSNSKRSQETSTFNYSSRIEYSPTLFAEGQSMRSHSARNQFSMTKLPSALPKVIKDNKVYSGLKSEGYLENMIGKLKTFTEERKKKTRKLTKNKTNLVSLSLETQRFAPVQSLVIRSLESPNPRPAPTSNTCQVSLGIEPRCMIRLPTVGKRKEMTVKKKKIVFSSPQPVIEDKVVKGKKPFTPFSFSKNRKKEDRQKPLHSNSKGLLTVSSFRVGKLEDSL
jgi:hypothetical protein